MCGEGPGAPGAGVGVAADPQTVTQIGFDTNVQEPYIIVMVEENPSKGRFNSLVSAVRVFNGRATLGRSP